jgi:hypothetical protein
LGDITKAQRLLCPLFEIFFFLCVDRSSAIGIYLLWI